MKITSKQGCPCSHIYENVREILSLPNIEAFLDKGTLYRQCEEDQYLLHWEPYAKAFNPFGEKGYIIVTKDDVIVEVSVLTIQEACKLTYLSIRFSEGNLALTNACLLQLGKIERKIQDTLEIA